MSELARITYEILAHAWRRRDTLLVDMKIEFGRLAGGEDRGSLVIADVIDNDSWRIWPQGREELMLDKQMYRNLPRSRRPTSSASSRRLRASRRHVGDVPADAPRHGRHRRRRRRARRAAHRRDRARARRSSALPTSVTSPRRRARRRYALQLVAQLDATFRASSSSPIGRTSALAGHDRRRDGIAGVPRLAATRRTTSRCAARKRSRSKTPCCSGACCSCRRTRARRCLQADARATAAAPNGTVAGVSADALARRMPVDAVSDAQWRRRRMRRLALSPTNCARIARAARARSDRSSRLLRVRRAVERALLVQEQPQHFCALADRGPTASCSGSARMRASCSSATWNGETYGIVVAHESHNHPSQVVPFEGAATGVGGIVRDVLCMGARVDRASRIRCASGRSTTRTPATSRRASSTASRRTATRSACRTSAGDVYFEDGFRDNCLVNVVALGLVKESEIIHSRAPADADGWDIVLVGKATDRSGFGGAAFSSLVLDEDDAEANKGAVQVPDPFLKNVFMRASYRAFDVVARREGRRRVQGSRRRRHHGLHRGAGCAPAASAR